MFMNCSPKDFTGKTITCIILIINIEIWDLDKFIFTTPGTLCRSEEFSKKIVHLGIVLPELWQELIRNTYEMLWLRNTLKLTESYITVRRNVLREILSKSRKILFSFVKSAFKSI